VQHQINALTIRKVYRYAVGRKRQTRSTGLPPLFLPLWRRKHHSLQSKELGKNTASPTPSSTSALLQEVQKSQKAPNGESFFSELLTQQSQGFSLKKKVAYSKTVPSPEEDKEEDAIEESQIESLISSDEDEVPEVPPEGSRRVGVLTQASCLGQDGRLLRGIRVEIDSFPLTQLPDLTQFEESQRDTDDASTDRDSPPQIVEQEEEEEDDDDDELGFEESQHIFNLKSQASRKRLKKKKRLSQWRRRNKAKKQPLSTSADSSESKTPPLSPLLRDFSQSPLNSPSLSRPFRVDPVPLSSLRLARTREELEPPAQIPNDSTTESTTEPAPASDETNKSKEEEVTATRVQLSMPKVGDCVLTRRDICYGRPSNSQKQKPNQQERQSSSQFFSADHILNRVSPTRAGAQQLLQHIFYEPIPPSTCLDNKDDEGLALPFKVTCISNQFADRVCIYN
jgi:hypothetical protein